MKKVLVIQFSQTGQLSGVLRSILAPLQEDPGLQVTVETLRPQQPFPFPWPLFRFFDTFPETVHGDVPALEPLSLDTQESYDLVILGYTAWFLSPSLPIQAFLKGPDAARLLKGKPVVTVVACRDMWLQAQEVVKQRLAALGARHVGHAALVDEAGSVGSFLATPLWMLSGSPAAKLGGLIPAAGVSAAKVAGARRFGERMAQRLAQGAALDAGLLQGLGAAPVNTALIATERAAKRGFRLWGRLLRALGPQGDWKRQVALVFYVAWLVLIILTLVPLGYLLRSLLGPLLRRRLEAQRAYFSAPSGE
jgi:hypothetical protein